MNPTPTDSGFDLMPTPYNPDNLTPEQYGADDGWRLLDEDEVGFQNKLWKLGVIQATQPDALGYWHSGPWECTALEWTYRTNLTRAELREARGIPEQPVSDTPSNEEWAMRRIEMLVSPVDRRVVIQIIREAIGVSVVPINAELAAAQRENAELRESLSKINDIRNSIVAFQSVNWSEHVYPLVAALNAAGLHGLQYQDALAKFKPLLDRAVEAEARAEAAEATVTKLRQALESIASVSESDMDSATFDLWSTAINALK